MTDNKHQRWAKWVGPTQVLPAGVRVLVLATDHAGPYLGGAAWVRWLPEGSEFPRYRSCDISDLEYEEEA
jgi:hypothetical protein